SLAPPLKNPGALHSSTLTCEFAWQTTASVLRQIAASASEFAAVPLNTSSTTASASNTRRIASSARRVQSSAPYAVAWPAFAAVIAASASGQMPALLSLANCGKAESDTICLRLGEPSPGRWVVESGVRPAYSRCSTQARTDLSA